MKSESEVAQSCPTLSDPMDWSLSGSSVHGIFQARVLEWGAIDSITIVLIVLGLLFVGLFLLLCLQPREVPLVFVVKLVWRC